jgi:hypothetical protein
MKRVKTGRAVRPAPAGDRPRRRGGATLRRVVLLMLGLVLVAGLLAAVVGRRAPERVYTVAQVRADLARQPAVWVGRTVLVRGVAVLSFWPIGPAGGGSVPCALPPATLPPAPHGPQSCPLAAPPTAPHGTTVYLRLVDDSARSDPRHPFFLLHPPNPLALDLAVQPVTPNPLITFERWVPPLARFLTAPGQVPGGVSHLYRVRLRLTSYAPCVNPLWSTCAAGVLVDAQP